MFTLSPQNLRDGLLAIFGKTDNVEDTIEDLLAEACDPDSKVDAAYKECSRNYFILWTYPMDSFSNLKRNDYVSNCTI